MPRDVPADTYCAYPQRDGLAELTWVAAGYAPMWFTRLQISLLTGPNVEQRQ